MAWSFGQPRKSTRTIALALTLSLIAAAAGCRSGGGLGIETTGSNDDPPAGSAPATTLPPPGVVAERFCGPADECAAEFILDRVVYTLSCGAIRNDAVSAEAIGSGLAFGQQVEVRTVEGYGPELLVAISIPGGHCAENDPDEVHTDWSMAFPASVSSVELTDAICAVGAMSAARAEVDGCTATDQPNADADTGPDTDVGVQAPVDVDHDGTVARFVEYLADGAYDTAAPMWSGYPGGDEDDEKLPVLERFVAENSWLTDGDWRLDVVDAFSFPQHEAMRVVSITDTKLRGAVAVLVGGDGLIHRLQLDDDLRAPIVLEPTEVVIAEIPVEGFAVAYLDGEAIPAEWIDVDHDTISTTITLPAGGTGDGDGDGDSRPRLLVVSMATPELPTAFAMLVDTD